MLQVPQSVYGLGASLKLHLHTKNVVLRASITDFPFLSLSSLPLPVLHLAAKSDTGSHSLKHCCTAQCYTTVSMLLLPSH